MAANSIIAKLFEVISPGRRQLRDRQKAHLVGTVQSQERMLAEYQALASLSSPTTREVCLGHFDFPAFRSEIESQRARINWENANRQIKKFHLPEMAGGVNPGDQRLLYHLVEFLNPTNVLEIGTHIGSSTIHIATAMVRHLKPDSSLTSVDILDVNCQDTKPWEKYGAKQSPRKMVDEIGFSNSMLFKIGPSVDFLASDNKKYDFIFLDGDHSASSVYREIPLALPRLTAGGVILLHDYFPNLKPLWSGDTNSALMHADVIPGVYLAVQRLINEGLPIMVTPFGELPWPTKLGSNVTSLALISAVE